MFLLKNIEVSIGKGLIFSLVAIIIVFVILVIIILCVNALSKIKFKEKVKTPVVMPSPSVKKLTIDDIKDEDMMVAALVATACFFDEVKEKDARLVSIKQIG